MTAFRSVLWGLTLALGVSACGGPAEVDRLTPREVMEGLRRGEKLVLADVRLPIQYHEEHIEGAVSLSYHQLTIKKVTPPTEGRLVLYCACPADEESLMTAEKLRKDYGIRDAAVLKGGLEAWKEAGGQVARGLK